MASHTLELDQPALRPARRLKACVSKGVPTNIQQRLALLEDCQRKHTASSLLGLTHAYSSILMQVSCRTSCMLGRLICPTHQIPKLLGLGQGFPTTFSNRGHWGDCKGFLFTLRRNMVESPTTILSPPPLWVVITAIFYQTI